MDPTEILNVRFHLGGEFIRIGPNLDYVGGDEEYSEIERDKLSLQEVKGYLKDHVQLKESMKIYFLIPGKALVDGLVFLNDDRKCVEMGEYICVGGVAGIYVEYQGEEDTEDSSSCSDFEDEMHISDDQPPVMTAEADSEDVVLVPDDRGVITEIISSPVKHSIARRHPVATDIDEPVFSQLCNPSQASVSDAMPQTADVSPIPVAAQQPLMSAPVADSEHSEDSDSDPEYMPHSEDSGEGSKVDTTGNVTSSHVPRSSSSQPASQAPAPRTAAVVTTDVTPDAFVVVRTDVAPDAFVVVRTDASLMLLWL
ncbi:hypothetical protein D1007_28092 [Hordeum vulgare]|nr:hypothetical protein D1007_28092 [Hordeum vulgare]